MSPASKLVLKWARRAHLYLSLFSLSLVLLFAATGFMLNHEEWFVGGEPATRTTEGAIDGRLLEGPDQLGIVEALRADHGATGRVESFDTDEDRVKVVFRRPGSSLEATIKRDDGTAELVFESRGFNGLLLDLHRGKGTGWVWGIVIDAVCVVLGVMALTGLVLWSSLKGRGRSGLAIIVVGAASAAGFVAWMALGRSPP